MSLLHGNLKAGEVNLPQGPLIHHAVAGHAQQLLGVGGKVLGAGGDAVRLDAPDETGGHFSRQVGVLREILKVPASQRAALDVQSRAQQGAYPLAGGLFSDGRAHLLGQSGVPAVGQARCGGEAGGGQTGIETQVVPRARLTAHAVRAVGEHHGGNARFGKLIGAPDVPAGQKSDLLLQGQLF